MDTDILNQVAALFSKDATVTMAGRLGEHENDIAAAIKEMIPLVMRGFSSKAGEGTDAANELLGLAKDAHNHSWWQQVADWYANTNNTTRSMDLLMAIFGPRNVESIAEHFAGRNHIKPASAVSLMQWVAPGCLSILGRYAEQHCISAGRLVAGLSELTAGIKVPGVLPVVPERFTLSGNMAGLQGRKQGRRVGKFLWPLALLLLSVAAWWLRDNACNRHHEFRDKAVVVADTSLDTYMDDPDIAPPVYTLNADSTLTYSLGNMITLRLPDSTELHVSSGGAEVLLLNKIKAALANGLDTTEEGKKDGWVNLYDIQFSEKLNYREGAMRQIRNIAAMLKAYPAVIIKLGGYTDNIGAAAANRKLSLRRAEKVRFNLYATGVGGQLEKSEGYGPDFPIADNTSPEGRAQNRRVACRIVHINK